MTECHILLVRHPETEANVSGRYVGRGDSAFTTEGKRQMRRLPAKVAAFKPDAIWSSPLQRANVLARAAGRVTGIEVREDARLVELDFGDAEGMTFDEISVAGMLFNYRDLDTPVAPNGESRGDIMRRTSAFFDDLLLLEGRHAIVTHGGVFRAGLVHLLGLDVKDIWAFHIHNAQLAYVRVTEGHGMLEEYRRG